LFCNLTQELPAILSHLLVCIFQQNADAWFLCNGEFHHQIVPQLSKTSACTFEPAVLASEIFRTNDRNPVDEEFEGFADDPLLLMMIVERKQIYRIEVRSVQTEKQRIDKRSEELH